MVYVWIGSDGFIVSEHNLPPSVKAKTIFVFTPTECYFGG